MAEGFFGPGSQSHPTRMRSHPMASFSICRHNELEPQPEDLAAKAQDCTRVNLGLQISSEFHPALETHLRLSLAVFCRLTFDPCFANSAHFHVIWWDATAAQQNSLKDSEGRSTESTRQRSSEEQFPLESRELERKDKRKPSEREDQPLVEKISKTSTSIHKYTTVYGHLCLIYDHRS